MVRMIGTTWQRMATAPQMVAMWLAAHLEESHSGGTIAALTGVRAIACLLVMGYHINLIMLSPLHLWRVEWNPFASALMLAGSSGVTLFFVLSGFLLFLPFCRAMLKGDPPPNTRLFYLRRMLRIMPGYYASLACLIALTHPEYLQPARWQQTVLFVTFLNDATPETFQKLNGPYWTLAIEWQFYLLLPWLALLIGALARRIRSHQRPLAIGFCLAGLIAWGIVTRWWGSYYVAHPTVTMLVPRRVLDVVLFIVYGHSGKYLEDFGVGMLAALCYLLAQGSDKDALIRLRRVIAPALGLAGLGMLVLMAMFLYSGYHQTWPLLHLLAQHYIWLNECVMSLGFAGCILAVLLGDGKLRSIMSRWPLKWIGTISYGVYIWHLPLLIAFLGMAEATLATLPTLLAFGCLWGWCIIVVLPFALVVYLLIERPGMRLSDRLRQRITRRASQSWQLISSSDAVEVASK